MLQPVMGQPQSSHPPSTTPIGTGSTSSANVERVITLDIDNISYKINVKQLQLPPRPPYNTNPKLLAHDWDDAPFEVNPGLRLKAGIKDWPSVFKNTEHWKHLKDDFSRYKVWNMTRRLNRLTSQKPPVVLCAGVATNRF
jgi:hypothetical protein